MDEEVFSNAPEEVDRMVLYIDMMANLDEEASCHKVHCVGANSADK
jgi:hypothetical protein